MRIVDVGCGQGGFTAALGRTVGNHGKVQAVDVSDEYLAEFNERLAKHGVENAVTFIQADATCLSSVISEGTADIVTAYRLLEELQCCGDMPEVIAQMATIVKRGGRVCLAELNAETKNEAEENYVRLHKESGDCFFKPAQVIRAMRRAGLTNVFEENVETCIWLSSELSKRDLSHAQVWFDADVKKSLGVLIDKYGLKYPTFTVFSGTRK